MTKLKWFSIGTALLVGAASGCSHQGHHHSHAGMGSAEAKETAPSAESEKKVAYVCSMCGVRQEKPGNCPKCGMKLQPA